MHKKACERKVAHRLFHSVFKRDQGACSVFFREEPPRLGGRSASKQTSCQKHHCHYQISNFHRFPPSIYACIVPVKDVGVLREAFFPSKAAYCWDSLPHGFSFFHRLASANFYKNYNIPLCLCQSFSFCLPLKKPCMFPYRANLIYSCVQPDRCTASRMIWKHTWFSSRLYNAFAPSMRFACTKTRACPRSVMPQAAGYRGPIHSLSIYSVDLSVLFRKS